MRRTVFLMLLVLWSGIAAFAANVTIPTFQLLTRGVLDDGLFVLQTRADIDIRLGGGYKYGGELGLSIRSVNLEEPSTPGAIYDQDVIQAAFRERLRLSSASVIVRDLFGLPVDARYFIGEYTRILNGELFPEQFGTRIIASNLRGLLAFPTGIVYDGVHAIDGTGLALTTTSIAPWLYLEGAFYQDAYLGPGHYSIDIRAAFNTPGIKAETFLGASHPGAQYGIYRAGLLLYYAAGPRTELFTQIGVPRWAPVDDGPLNIDAFYFLFEPRVHVGVVSIVLSLFWHPQYYVQAPTNEQGATDIIVRLVAGDRSEGMVSGGIENSIRLRPTSADDQLRVGVAPFVTITSSGVVWDLKTNFNLFPFEAASLFEAYAGVRTRF